MGALLKNHDIRFVPLQAWPCQRSVQRPSQFKASYSQTCELLNRELWALRAEYVVIQADCDASQIRNDGMLRGDARMRGPGIVLSFESKFGPLSYPCDRFMRWQDNLRAIALSLEALRAVDRYGVTRRAEQYRGWKALTLRGDDEFQNADEAAAFLARHHPGATRAALLSDIEAARRAYKHAAAANHPDRGGAADLFSRITAAWEILRSYHERRKVG
jgi:hypothetical protein